MKKREYLQCPLCGWVRPKNYVGGEFRFDKVDAKSVLVWQVKEMGGYRSGFKLIEGKKLRELPDELKEQIRTQCKRILEELGEMKDEKEKSKG